ncbi:dihydrodipicolinate synthase family protein [Halococcus agarilyticus]|uniref:dihydrodipicolinate synthase family protein n=1 Tax=Halococcus agarilyticus TaxID=1232219 RepID=UPI000677671F|nr:dihydrodipicolinate synthase family protein [Halococcus agarilyticus]
MTETTLHGVCPIVDTPFTESGDVDYGGLEFLSETLIDGGCHALALFGYASEFYKLNEEERERMTRIVVDACDRGGIPSIVSVTAQSTDVAIDQAQFIEKSGADALMILPPHVRGPPESGVFDHLEAIAESVSLPVMVQYAPGSTGMTHSPRFFANLYDEVENIDYFKIECDPPGKFVSRLHELTDGGANVLVGRAGYEMIEGYDRGAVGVMPASAMYDIYLRIHTYYQQGDRQRAVDLHSELVALLNQLTKVGIQFEKRILADRGLVDSAYCRAPETTFDETYDDIYEEYYEKYVEPNIDAKQTAEATD